MSPIRNNPYRTLGLLANARDAELDEQGTKFMRFAEVNKSLTSDYDFPFLGTFTRDLNSLQDAASKIEQAKNRVYHGLFWFLNTNSVDEIAFNHLKEKNTSKARDIWLKLAGNANITERNFSAAINLSTLLLGFITKDSSFSYKLFKEAIDMKGNVLTSQAFPAFAAAIAGVHASVDRNWVFEKFIDDVTRLVKPYLDTEKGLSIPQLVDSFSSYPSGIQQYLSEKFTHEPLAAIENKIEETGGIRIKHPDAAGKYGEKLFNETIDNLNFLNSVWGVNNIQYLRIVNKLAEEILQCAIDFFKEYRDSEQYDPGENAMRLIIMAKNIGPTGQVKSRLAENMENLQEWIDDKHERDKQLKISTDISYINQKLKNFQILQNTFPNVKHLLDSCKPKLMNARASLGGNDEFYLKISSTVINNAQGMIIEIVNKALEKYPASTGIAGLSLLAEIINNAWDLTESMCSLDIEPTSKEHFFKNRKSLEDLRNQLKEAKADSEKQAQISSDIDFIKEKLRGFQDLTATISNAKNLIDTCELKLTHIKCILGSSDEFYIQISSAVVNNAQGMLVAVVNKAQETLPPSGGITALYSLQKIINDACGAIVQLSTFAMDPELKEHFIKNKEAFSNLKQSLVAASLSRPTVKSNSGCYIATMVYGDYDHPQVLILRKFRDDLLVQSVPGRFFIRHYYKFSPAIVEKLKGNVIINGLIKRLLNLFVRTIK